MITAIDFPIDTGLGILNTVEVTYTNLEGYVVHIDYYAKNLGLVYRNYTLNKDVLYDVKYYD